MGPAAKAARPVLNSIVKNPEHTARILAARTMCRIGPEGRAEALIVMPTLISQLAAGKTPRDRAWAAEVLAEMGPDARKAISTLLSASRDRAPEVRRAAIYALQMIDAAVSESESADPNTP
jgi:HEAT repeat protein